ncbi:MAG: M24 family metallopeptidase [Verrucomicrobiota bacterium]
MLDIFPRHATNYYYGDLTRTVVRGRASEPLRKQYATVQSGKRWVMRQMRAGADGPALQKDLIARFKDEGFSTEQRGGRWVGMFHGVGHGLGLDLHESPRFAAGKLFAGLSITVEPGLYFPRRRRRASGGRRHRRQERRAQSDQVRGGAGAALMKLIPVEQLAAESASLSAGHPADRRHRPPQPSFPSLQPPARPLQLRLLHAAGRRHPVSAPSTQRPRRCHRGNNALAVLALRRRSQERQRPMGGHRGDLQRP